MQSIAFVYIFLPCIAFCNLRVVYAVTRALQKNNNNNSNKILHNSADKQLIVKNDVHNIDTKIKYRKFFIHYFISYLLTGTISFSFMFESEIIIVQNWIRQICLN